MTDVDRLCPCLVVRSRWKGDRPCTPGEPGVWRISSITVCDVHQRELNDGLEFVVAQMQKVRAAVKP